MEQKRLALYTIDMKYVRNLSIAEERRRGKKHNHVFSVSPQSGKDIRPFIGVIVICGDKQYCVPLSSPKEKHNTMNNDVDFSKVYSPKGKLIGVLNFNDMIPVRDDVIRLLDVNPHKGDSQAMIQYKILARNQLTFCHQNQDAIVRKANKLYRLITGKKANSFLRSRCCDFKNLESVLEKYAPKE